MQLHHRSPDSAVSGGHFSSFSRERLQPGRNARSATAQKKETKAQAHNLAGREHKTAKLGHQKVKRSGLGLSVHDTMLAAVPGLRAFARSLSGNVDRADDLVQETLLRAIANIDSFQPGTNMPAWLCTILRNLFRSEFRKRRYEVEDVDGSYLDSLQSSPEQYIRLEFMELLDALATLPAAQREALILVGASGFSYDDAAAICETAVGTIKSRVNRARKRLTELLEIEAPAHSIQAYASSRLGA